MLATCIDVSGSEYPMQFAGQPTTPIQGKSLLPILQGKQRDWHDLLYFQFANNRAIRRGDWKAVSAIGGKWELYNIAEDRTLLNDLSASKPELTTELSNLWHEVAEKTDQAPANFRKPSTNKQMTFPPGSMTQRAAGPGSKTESPGRKQKNRKN